GLVRELEIFLAHADGDQRVGREPEALDEETLHSLGAALRKTAVVLRAALAVGVTVDEEDGALELRLREDVAKRRDRRHGLRTDHGRAEVEVDLKVDLRLVLDDLNDLLALLLPFLRLFWAARLDGNRAGLDLVDEALLFSLLWVDTRAPDGAGQRAPVRLGLQRIPDLVLERLRRGSARERKADGEDCAGK